MSAMDLGGGNEADNSICRHRFLGIMKFFLFSLHGSVKNGCVGVLCTLLGIYYCLREV